MFHFNISPSSPAELSAYLEAIKASGIAFAAPSASFAAPAGASPAIATRYKEAMGKGKATLSQAELERVGFTGKLADASPQVKEAAMLASIQEATGETVEPMPGDAAPETGAFYEAESELQEPSADADY